MVTISWKCVYPNLDPNPVDTISKARALSTDVGLWWRVPSAPNWPKLATRCVQDSRQGLALTLNLTQVEARESQMEARAKALTLTLTLAPTLATLSLPYLVYCFSVVSPVVYHVSHKIVAVAVAVAESEADHKGI